MLLAHVHARFSMMIAAFFLSFLLLPSLITSSPHLQQEVEVLDSWNQEMLGLERDIEADLAFKTTDRSLVYFLSNDVASYLLPRLPTITGIPPGKCIDFNVAKYNMTTTLDSIMNKMKDGAIVVVHGLESLLHSQEDASFLSFLHSTTDANSLYAKLVLVLLWDTIHAPMHDVTSFKHIISQAPDLNVDAIVGRISKFKSKSFPFVSQTWKEKLAKSTEQVCTSLIVSVSTAKRSFFNPGMGIYFMIMLAMVALVTLLHPLHPHHAAATTPSQQQQQVNVGSHAMPQTAAVKRIERITTSSSTYISSSTLACEAVERKDDDIFSMSSDGGKSTKKKRRKSAFGNTTGGGAGGRRKSTRQADNNRRKSLRKQPEA